ncbi:protein FAM200C-like [Watersipora subatra]|uniref:protein FAM200C-like n=1 Tax=Watersipora subatra TaxID=2589382 RepID=UPI00355C37FA
MASKKRDYDNSYLDNGFTCLTTKDKEERPQCVICHKVITNDSMNPAKLKLRSSSQHPALVNHDRTFFERQETSLKKKILSSDGTFQYVNNGNIKEEFLFCSALKTTTRASDIFDKVSQFFKTEKLSSGNLCSCCTDGAPSMLGSSSGFQTRVKQLVPDVKSVHCMIHRQALAAKALFESFSAILNQHYFSEVSESELSLIRNPFRCFAKSVPDELQEELLDLQNDSSAKDVNEDKTIEEFWPSMIHLYPQTAKHAV